LIVVALSDRFVYKLFERMFSERGGAFHLSGSSSVVWTARGNLILDSKGGNSMSGVIAAPQTDAQRKLLELVKRWIETYNNEGENFVRVCYSPDAHILLPGGEVRGHEQYLKIEEAVLGACPKRKLRLDRVRFSDEDTAIVEGVLLDDARPDFYSPFCCILTARDGKFVEEHAYINPGQWPGLDAAAAYVTPGGLGK
jgi:hypothetical protein